MTTEQAIARQAARDNLVAELTQALQAIVDECSFGHKPYSNDSFLPEHLLEQARSAIAKATGAQA
ncbi:hypothetical protein [Cupriavidus sp. a3]|uniref:hypothetical protein n=1 Tax=Cupriavidus sp. a3 TaxID=3242158 RepID=UPI003D9C5040